MSYIMLSEDDVKQAIADYITKNYRETILRRVSNVVTYLGFQSEVQVSPVKVYLNKVEK